MNPSVFPEYKELCRQFDTEETCEKALFQAKWPNGYSCPVCGHGQAYSIKTRRLTLYQCRDCRRQTTVTAGMIMEGSRTPLRKWFQALILNSFMFGITAKEMSRILQVTYKTAWLMCHKIRRAMGHAESRELLTGMIRVQSAHYRRDVRATSKYLTAWKQPVIAAASISRTGKILKMRIRVLSKSHVNHRKVHPAAVRSLLSKFVDPATKHLSIVPEIYSKDRNVEFNLQILRACLWINQTFLGGIGAKHLQAYLDQSCFMYKAEDWAATFFSLLNWSAASPRITYSVLVGRDQSMPHRSTCNRTRDAQRSMVG